MQELNVAEWVRHPQALRLVSLGHIAEQTELLNHGLGTRMGRKDDRDRAADIPENAEDRSERCRLIDIRRAMQRECGKAAPLRGPTGPSGPALWQVHGGSSGCRS